MKRFTDPIRSCVDNQIWMPALMAALTLPDICAWLETPDESSTRRYPRWSSAWIEPRYTIRGGHSDEHIFLRGSDLYALRCAILHSGQDDITEQKARKVLNDFEFTVPQPGRMMHNNHVNDTLQLQVDIFCRDICDAVDDWNSDKKDDTEISTRLKSLVNIHDFSRKIRL